MLSVAKFCNNGPCLEKMFWLRSNSYQAMQHIEDGSDGLEFCLLMTQF